MNENQPIECAVCEAMCPDAVDGTLTAAERRVFERHVAHCPNCARELRRGSARSGVAGNAEGTYTGASGGSAGEDSGRDDGNRGCQGCYAGVCAGASGARGCSGVGTDLGAAEGGGCLPHRDEAGDLPATDGDDGSDGVCFDCADAEPDGRAAEEPAGLRLYAVRACVAMWPRRVQRPRGTSRTCAWCTRWSRG